MNTTKRKTVASDSELDAPLLRFAAEYMTLNSEINAGLATVDGNVPDKTAERVSAMEAEIGRLPVPYTLSGIAALLRVKAACIGTRWPDRAEDRIVLLALQALERFIAGKGKGAVVQRVTSISEADAELLRLNAEYRTLLGEINALKHNDEKGDLSAEASGRMEDLERKIADTPAETYAGIGIKLLIGVDNLDPLDPGETRTADHLNLESALADAERLAGGASSTGAPETTGEDPFEALAAEWAEQKAECERISKAEEEAGVTEFGSPSDAAGDRLGEIEKRISETPTTTLFGIVTKLRVEASAEVEYEFWTTENVIKTALKGAEHLLAQSKKAA